MSENISSKSRLAYTILAFFLGWLGVHRFYAGKIGTGILILILGLLFVFSGFLIFIIPPLAFITWPIDLILGLWLLIDFLVGLFGGATDSDKQKIRNW